MAKRRTFRVNADSIGKLVDILVGTPDDFNSPYSDKLYGYAETRPMSTGLNGADYDILMADRKQERISYVIYSYGVPIAWRIYDRAFPSKNDRQYWVMAQHPRSSMTTAKHIAKVRTALRQISGGEHV